MQHKLQFLCSNHRQWLMNNPAAANDTWRRSYSQGLDLASDNDYVAAARHAGAAFETADIIMVQAGTLEQSDLDRFTDSSILLAQLLRRMREPELASSVIIAGIDRLERLLTHGLMPQRPILDACIRLQRVNEAPYPSAPFLQAPSAGKPAAVTPAPVASATTVTRGQLH